jgi:Nuclease-related domain
MAWPKLRNRRGGATHEGAQSQGGAPAGAPAGPEGPGGPAREPAAEPGPEASAAWPGQPQAAEAVAGDVATAGAAEEEPFWDLSQPEDPGDDPVGGFRWERVADMPPPDSGGDEQPAPSQADAERAAPPRPQWKAVVTPVEEAEGASLAPGIGQRRGNLAHLSGNPRMRAWRLRIIVAAVVMLAFSLWISWQLGLTLAVIVVIADTIYRSRKGYAGQARLTGAQRRTIRQLAKLRRAGYRALHGGIIPESEDQIDHLVIGPAGVFAIDSEDWDRRLAVRTRKGKELWHGPFSKKDRLEHAQWEAQRAGELLSGVISKPVTVRPALAVYGPRIPWDVATIREVDVFSGPRLRKYLRRRARQNGVRPLSDDEVEKIYQAADQAFPHLSSASKAS